MNKKLSATGAAVYVRKSAKHQSICDQMEAIRKFAKRRGLIIVKVYSDGGNQAEHSMPAKAQKTK
jgi:DNA invertase Pin-like site-specific DNA recombinase